MADIPAEMADEAAKAREKLIESAVEMDDEIMERYLNGDEIKNDEIEACLKGGIWNRRIVPVLVGSAGKAMGVQLLFDHLVTYAPDPLYKGKAEGIDPRTGKAVDRQMSAGEPFSAFVFKTITDPFAGKLTLFKVYSGELAPGQRGPRRQEGRERADRADILPCR